MSTLKVGGIRGVSASSDAITVANDGSCTANLTNRTNKNLIINGAMQIAQRGTSFSGTAQQYTLDRMQMNTAGNDEIAQTEQAAVTAGGAYTSGFRKCMKIINGNQTSGAGAADIVHLKMVLEAQDIANSGWNYTSTSSFITLSFWIKSSVAQDFPITLRSEDGTRQVYNMTTGSLSADTWTKITKTIPGNSNLQFDDNENAGLTLFINAFVGTDYTTGSLTQNAWSAWSSAKQGDNMSSSWYTTDNATLEITGLQLEVGSVATDFEHRSFAEELNLCKRYFNMVNGGNQSAAIYGIAYANSNCHIIFNYPVEMRTAASAYLVNGTDYWAYIRYSSTVDAFDTLTQNISTSKNHMELMGSGNMSNSGYAGIIRPNNSTARLGFDAEL